MQRFRPKPTRVGLALTIVASLAILAAGPVDSAPAAEPLGSITKFSAGLNPGSTPQGIVAGADGNLWFADNAVGGLAPAIGRINPTTGTITEFSSGLNAGSSPFGIAAGPDGNVWFADQGTTGAIGRVTPAGAITEFSAGLNPNSRPFAIAAGPDGNLWFADRGATRAIGRINPGTQAITEFSAGLSPDSTPQGIAAGPDGNLWFTDAGNTPAIGRITPAGAITEFSAGLNPDSCPQAIAAGPDGNLWFNNGCDTPAIGRINPNTGAISEFSAGVSGGGLGIAAGPKDVWFTEQEPAVIGRITTGGAITEFSKGLDLDDDPRFIAAGPEENMWFTEDGATPAIGRIGTALTLSLKARGKQSVKRLKVRVGCGDVACEAELSGKAVAKRANMDGKHATKKRGKKTFKIKRETFSIPAGKRKTKRVTFKNKKSVQRLHRLLKRKPYRKGTKAKIKITATDTADNEARERATVKLRP
jgi:virginiamycin B lyase